MDILIWGTGRYAGFAYDHIKYVNKMMGYDYYNIIAFIDNDSSKIGKKYKDFDILSKNQILEYRCPIVIAIKNSNDVEKQIKKIYKNYCLFYDFVYNDVLLEEAWREIPDKQNDLYKKMIAKDKVLSGECNDSIECILGAASRFSTNIEEAAKFFDTVQYNNYTQKSNSLKTIALYYYRFSNGGIERLLSYLTQKFLDNGYNVLLITDQLEQSKEYDLNSRITRIVLPISHYKNIYTWMMNMKEIMERYSVDILISHQSYWEGNYYLSLLSHAIGVKFLIEIHSHYSAFVDYNEERYCCLYKNTDAVICLSPSDEKYWRNNGVDAFYIPNIVSVSEIREIPDYNEIVWIGRLEQEQKRILDLPEIAHRILKRKIDVRFRIVGEFDNYNIKKIFNEKINLYHLENSFIFDGYKTDVDYAYNNASLMLLTSNYEGFPMTVAEAMGHGVPVVSYNINYISMFSSGKGCVLIPMHDINAMANEVVNLLENKQKLKQLSEEAFCIANDFSKIDIVKKWENVFRYVMEH